MSQLPKIGRKKKDPLGGGVSENSGFWQPALNRIGKALVKRRAITVEEWREFSGKSGPWVILKGIACDPATSLAPGSPWVEWFCLQVIKRPVVTPMFVAMIREEVAATSELERWLFYLPMRHTAADGDLCRMYQSDTGKKVSVASMAQARENLYRRCKTAPFGGVTNPAIRLAQSGKR